MNDNVKSFVRNRQIDSFQKLRMLLYVFEHPHSIETCQDLANHLFLETPLVERIVRELQRAGLIHQVQSKYTVSDEPDVHLCLQQISNSFNDPVARQRVLECIRNDNSSYSWYPENTNEYEQSH